MLTLAPEVDLISRSLSVLGEWCYAEPLLLAPMLNPDDLLYDVGGFLGTFSLGLAGLTPLAQIVAVEGNPLVQPLLKQNLAANAPCPVMVCSVAVGQREGWLKVDDGAASGNFGATAFVSATATDAGAVRATTLAHLRKEHGDYSVLKLDIEGMEREALLGDEAYIRKTQPVIWAECNETAASYDLLSALVWLGYEPIYIAFPAFRRKNFNISSDLIYPMAYEAALLAAPAGRLARFTGKVDSEEPIVRPVRGKHDLRMAMWSTPRWGNTDWASLSRPELYALLGHTMKGTVIEDFLPFK